MIKHSNRVIKKKGFYSLNSPQILCLVSIQFTQPKRNGLGGERKQKKAGAGKGNEISNKLFQRQNKFSEIKMNSCQIAVNIKRFLNNSNKTLLTRNDGRFVPAN